MVHLHEATNTHYDLRLQIGGTLKSFAVPKGPSLDPAQKRLAVLTEDHPLEYVEFEDVIPEGNYGAGAMIVWDQGRVQYLDGTAEEGIARGKIDFVLSGFKLNGRFALVETGHRQGKGSRADGKQWLLIKKADRYASDRDLLAEEPRGVLGGLTADELEHRVELAGRLVERARELGAESGELDAARLKPKAWAPEGATPGDADRVYELALDGVRLVADKHGRAVALRDENGRSATAAYPEIARAVAALAPERVVLDGQIVAFDDEGRPSFERLAPRLFAERPLEVQRAQAVAKVTYFAFDLLALGELDTRSLPLEARKRLLAEVVKGRGYLRVLDHVDDGRALLAFCEEKRLDGVVAKRRASPYLTASGTSDDWVMIRAERADPFVVTGYVPARGGGVAALRVASFVADALVDRGTVKCEHGAGADELRDGLAALEQSEPPFGAPPADTKGVRWVRPELVASVRYRGFYEQGTLRAARFQGIAREVAPRDCRALSPKEALSRPPPLEDEDDEPRAEGAHAPPVAAPKPSARVNLTNRDKVFWPEEGYTKGDLINYYVAMAQVMLPFLRDRPVVMVRYPDGFRGKSFFQWNVPEATPDWLRRGVLRDEEKGKEKTVFLIDDTDSLAYLANLGTIPLHVLACREETREECDFLTIDFDIGDHPFERAVVLALSLREILEQAGFRGFPKTSGQKGLHVLVPLGPGIGFDTAKLLCELLGRLVTARHPKLSTMERRVDKRGGRALVDVGQTGPSRTIVAPYSVRAWPGATVSTPLSWQEVHVALDPRRFSLLTVPTRVAESGDPFHDLLSERPDVPLAVAKLAELAGMAPG